MWDRCKNYGPANVSHRDQWRFEDRQGGTETCGQLYYNNKISNDISTNSWGSFLAAQSLRADRPPVALRC